MACCPLQGVSQEAETEDSRTTLDGVYTEEQAGRGEEVVDDVCGSCHMEDWFMGTFMVAWSGASVQALYDKIRTTMPEDSPSSLSRQEYADVLAYIFALNGLPPGDVELKARKSVMSRILIQRRD